MVLALMSRPEPLGAHMRCPKRTCNDILASRTYFTTGWCSFFSKPVEIKSYFMNLKSEARETIRKMVDIVVMSLIT